MGEIFRHPDLFLPPLIAGVALVAACALMSVLVILIYRYYGVFKDTSASFAIGLMMVFAVFLVQNLLALPFLVQEFGYSGQELGPFWVYPEVLELIALIIFFYISE